MVGSGPSLLECQDLHKSWGGIRALAGVSIDVCHAEIVGLAGANGAGKTTLLNVVAGLVRLNRGEVRFCGRRISGLSPVAIRRLGIGRTFQRTRVITRRRVLENVALAAAYGRADRRFPPLRLGPDDFAIAREALQLVQLQDAESAFVHELDTFAEKRLMLAMAIVPPPRLLLLDEPAGGLSPSEVDEVAEMVLGLRIRGATILLVDHVMSFITGLADRMVVLHEGQVLVDGSVDDVVRNERVRETWLGDPEREASHA